MVGILTRLSLPFLLLMITAAVISQELRTDDDHEDDESGVRYRIGTLNQPASMTCILIDFLSAWHTNWFKDNQKIKEGLSGENQRTLTINVNSSTLKSEFKCATTYRLGGQDLEKTATWKFATSPTVKFLDPKEKIKLVKIDPANLQNVILECKYTGVPEPVVTWTFGEDQTFTTSTERHQLRTQDKIATMTIHRFNLSDLGTYKCTAANLASTDHDSITVEEDSGGIPVWAIVLIVLAVLGVPSAAGGFFMWKRKNSTGNQQTGAACEVPLKTKQTEDNDDDGNKEEST